MYYSFCAMQTIGNTWKIHRHRQTNIWIDVSRSSTHKSTLYILISGQKSAQSQINKTNHKKLRFLLFRWVSMAFDLIAATRRIESQMWHSIGNKQINKWMNETKKILFNTWRYLLVFCDVFLFVTCSVDLSYLFWRIWYSVSF